MTTCDFDAVLLDYEMPGMKGCDVAFEIKRLRPELAVILLSGSEVPKYALTWSMLLYSNLKQAERCCQR